MAAERRDLQAAGFRLLLEGRPVTPATLAVALRSTPEAVAADMRAAAERGSARIDAAGNLVAIAGLSVVPDRHEIAGRRYWTWCAFDALGIMAALRATGRLRTADPATSTPLVIEFEGGVASPATPVLFLPEMEECSSVIDDWCPNANLFASDAGARTWAEKRGIGGQVLALADAAQLGADQWRPLLPIRLAPP